MKKSKRVSGKSNETNKVFYEDLINNNSKRADEYKQAAEQRRLLKKEQKVFNALKGAKAIAHYLHNLVQMKNKVGKAIILVVVSGDTTIKAKLAMSDKEDTFLKESRNMQAAISTNTLGYFSPAFAQISDWESQNGALGKALDAIKNKIVGAAGMKKTALKNLNVTLKLALAYVNGLMLLNQDEAKTIAEAALMTVVLPATRNKPPISAKQSSTSGAIKLAVIAVRIGKKRVTASYEWQYSLDNGVTWIALPNTVTAKTVALNMPIGKSVIFRSRSTSSKGGTSEWVISKAIMVA